MATRTMSLAKRSTKYREEVLYRRLFRGGSSPQSIRSELEGFLLNRRRVFKWEVDMSVRKLRNHGQFHSALKLSEVMAKRGINPKVSDQAIRLDLVAKSRGISAAEEYFSNLPASSKNHLVYGALLNCYCKELMDVKAEALMVKMKELNFCSSAMSYNSLMTMYTKIKQPERIPGIIQEMKADDVMPDCYTYNVWMRSLATVGDISGVERVLEEMRRNGRVDADWTTYSNLASIYIEVGLFQKAEGALKELEKRNTSQDLEAYQFLITLYGKTGNLVEVHRIWRSLKLAHHKMANMSYLNMIQVLGKLKDISGAEACFKEWESKFYDIMGTKTVQDGSDDVVVIKKHDKMKGIRIHVRTWEKFVDFYVRNGTVKKANLSDLPGGEECFKEWESENPVKKLRGQREPPERMRDGRPTARTWEMFLDYYLKRHDLKEVNLKDLPDGEESFKKWTTRYTAYDIRVANAMIALYIEEGSFDKALATKKRAKMLGGRLNAKSWEIFMNHHLKEGDLKQAHWCADRAIKKGRSQGRIWVPPQEVILTLMGHFESEKDVEGAEKFITNLRKVEKDLAAEVFEALIRTYAAAGKKSPSMRRRLKMENLLVDDDTMKLLDVICEEGAL